ncbi:MULTISPECIES: globin [Brevibacillus]|jgi:hemoglobin|uniref:Globin n=1 Tax=Brevibacillus aydinogluensis TaxID=927786 RepID=A0AA48MAX5_9BACL|nr:MULTISPECIES: globin [Brevibacillus]REK67623.1 MAG: globin [Brevibacillus sp.]MBR8661363.1 globin [Brevibacillus sp. NL20B1]MDT3417617.1 hemoglobin [Brevibacillus aydinogluensis]NNV04150.1 globin [Brevibacillus sp. MCWH]CAJ1004494.1 Globin [Brevibacillus aydinogluensis]
MFQPLQTPYELIGGAETLSRLVDTFYDLVKEHPDLAPLFPEDFTEIKEKQYMFLTQFLGGPTLYSDRYGHPMMRARHMRFPITPKRAEAWLACMSEAMDRIGLEGEVRHHIFERLRLTAYHMVNQWEPDDKQA